MNWDDLRIFLAVARNGSISGAARQLNLQHSTVSRRMRKLEADFGARLFDKMPGGYTLTPAGEGLQQAAARMEQEVLGVDGRLGGIDARLHGPLRVTAVDNMATTVLMPMFAGFCQEHPQVTLHLMVSNSDASLVRREADVAIRLTNSPPDTLIGKRVVTVSSAVYASPTYLQRLRTEGGEPEWLGVECCSFHRDWTHQACSTQRHHLVVDDTLVTLAALREGLGVSILPCFLGDRDGGLVRMEESRPEWDLGLWILLHPDLRRTARVLAFREYMIPAIEREWQAFSGAARPGTDRA